ncbi:hypothetical protein HN873_000045 [Arachis hypogaea]
MKEEEELEAGGCWYCAAKVKRRTIPFHWPKAEPPPRATIASIICDHCVQPPPSILSFPIMSRVVELSSWRTTSAGPEFTVAANLPSSSPSSTHRTLVLSQLPASPSPPPSPPAFTQHRHIFLPHFLFSAKESSTFIFVPHHRTTATAIAAATTTLPVSSPHLLLLVISITHDD